MSDQEYGLVMPFFDQSESFTLGFEVGSLWMTWRLGTYGECLVHVKNLDQLRRMATHFDLSMKIEALDDEWATINVSKVARLSLATNTEITP